MPTTTYTRVFGEILSENRNGSEIDYVSDVQGNVLELRTANGSASDTASYWPFGSVRSHKGGTPMPYGFVGAYGVRTDATNRQHAGRRAYSSERGRFEQRDPVPSDWTRYSYGLDNPVSYADWNGKQGEIVIMPRGPSRGNRKPRRGPFWPARGIVRGYEYGYYCGSDTIENPGWAILPQDCLDACCQIHDRCLEAHFGAGWGQRGAHRCCDGALHACADWVHNSKDDCCARSPRPADCRNAAPTIMRGMALGGTYYFGAPPDDCIPKEQWPDLVRLHWGNPNCGSPSGENTEPPYWLGPGGH